MLSSLHVTAPSTQWYKVYQDPEGTRSLEKTDGIDAVTPQSPKVIINSTDENFYKSRIMSLNEEIINLNKKNKALNDELAMVSECINHYNIAS